MNLEQFEFSQNYAMYYDKLERVNYFLKDVAALVAAGEPSDSRLMQHVLKPLSIRRTSRMAESSTISRCCGAVHLRAGADHAVPVGRHGPRPGFDEAAPLL